MTLALRQLGKDVATYLAGDAPLPGEYRFMALDDLQRSSVPADAGDRVLVCVDCANESRLGPDPEILQIAPLVLDIDHHHDNTRFGDVNLVVSGSLVHRRGAARRLPAARRRDHARSPSRSTSRS